ncbi:MAG: hypothetical protein ABUS48_03735 [Pseudomonadota bacterium]
MASQMNHCVGAGGAAGADVAAALVVAVDVVDVCALQPANINTMSKARPGGIMLFR